MVSDSLRWSKMVSDGPRWSQVFLDGLSWLISIAIEWFKTLKIISVRIDGLDWMYLRVFGGIEHRTMRIKPTMTKPNCECLPAIG